MTQTKLLVGSLSNDLLRVANMVYRGSHNCASVFLREAKRWGHELSDHNMKDYISKIVREINNINSSDLSKDMAEKLLMYSVLLQNYSLHID